MCISQNQEALCKPSLYTLYTVYILFCVRWPCNRVKLFKWTLDRHSLKKYWSRGVSFQTGSNGVWRCNVGWWVSTTMSCICTEGSKSSVMATPKSRQEETPRRLTPQRVVNMSLIFVRSLFSNNKWQVFNSFPAWHKNMSFTFLNKRLIH